MYTKRWLAGGAAGAMLLASAGCGSDGSARASELAPAQVTIIPANGTAKARPDKPVVVQAAGGKLDAVAFTSGTHQLPGTFNADHTRWTSNWTLKPGAKFAVQATAKNADGKPTSASQAFATQKAAKTFTVSQDPILEDDRHGTYGVGLPIILNFDEPVTDKAAVQKALTVTAQKPVPGAWRWMGDQQVIYRTKTYWPAHQKVTVTAHLTGVHGGKNRYGVKDFTRTYRIGRSQIAYLNIKKHKMWVEWDGKLKRKVPISAGMGGSTEYTTTSGIHLNMEKAPSVWMTSPNRSKGDAGYYHELIHYVVRISNAGEYLHATPGEEGCLGHSNCSHGCVRQPHSDAVWYYHHSQPGDPVDIKGTDRQVEYDNGWAYWQLPYKKWAKS